MIVFPVVFALLVGASPVDRAAALRGEALEPQFEALKPLHRPPRKPRPDDWLARHPERGESALDYTFDRPIRPTDRRRTLYVQMIGTFSKDQVKIVKLAADYAERFFGLPVKLASPLPDSVVPSAGRRLHPSLGTRQILTTYVMEKVLAPRLPNDALASIAFTSEDLWPGDGWNFVFGQASLHDRVGVWSIHRFGDPSTSPAAFLTCLLRTVKVATHELSHMLALKHCVAYQCLMNGANHQQESDATPLEPCPVCLQKLWWNTELDPAKRFERLATFYKANGLSSELPYLEKALTVVRAAPPLR
jgi:archaemetzincin